VLAVRPNDVNISGGNSDTSILGPITSSAGIGDVCNNGLFVFGVSRRRERGGGGIGGSENRREAESIRTHLNNIIDPVA
jgi:hypothetical protein